MTWHWIITLNWKNPHGQLINSTTSGTIDPDQAAALGSRSAAYDAVLEAARGANNFPDGVAGTVLFFALEPDALSAPASEPALTAGGAS
jgi:hypothetical protein